jgi:hypothetical protein
MPGMSAPQHPVTVVATPSCADLAISVTDILCGNVQRSTRVVRRTANGRR